MQETSFVVFAVKVIPKVAWWKWTEWCLVKNPHYEPALQNWVFDNIQDAPFRHNIGPTNTVFYHSCRISCVTDYSHILLWHDGQFAVGKSMISLFTQVLADQIPRQLRTTQ
jgi:hypothetical protein